MGYCNCEYHGHEVLFQNYIVLFLMRNIYPLTPLQGGLIYMIQKVL